MLIDLSSKFEMPEEEAIVVYDVLEDDDITQTTATLVKQIFVLLFSNQTGEAQH